MYPEFKLTIEPIAQNNWGTSLVHYLPPEVWDVVRKEVYARSKYSCMICGEENVELHCHEVWLYYEKDRIQKLQRLICICSKCHHIKHWGGTVAAVHKKQYPYTYLAELEQHFCKVNGCTPAQFLEYRVYMGEISQMRSRIKYELSWGVYEPKKLIAAWAKENKKR